MDGRKKCRPCLRIAYETAREVNLPNRLSEGIWTRGMWKARWEKFRKCTIAFYVDTSS